jgi:two-component system sensor histidine kinase YesM
MDEIITTKNEIGGFISWLLLAVLVLVLLISAFMSAKISQPIKRLERSMRKVEQGDFEIHIPVQGDDEVGRLSRRFNLMVANIRELRDQIIHEQEAKRESELEVLQAQINPHFLYNTLNSVVRMAGSGKSEDVITMITSLSKFFRISLSRGKRIITVREELEHIRNYLIIQKIRYKNKFEYEITADEEVLSCKTLKLILQPLVENAIYHGIEMMADEGWIHITAGIVDDKVLLEVKDNGLGIPQDKLGSILSGEVKSDEGSSVGVKNVHERIRLTFGEAYGLQIESQLEEGTSVKVWIPILREEGEVERL